MCFIRQVSRSGKSQVVSSSASSDVYEKQLEYYPDVSPSEITSIHIRQYLVLLKKKVSAKTVYEVQSALRKFFRFLMDEGEIAGSPCDRIQLTRYRVDSQPLYSLDEIKALLASCDLRTPSSIRD